MSHNRLFELRQEPFKSADDYINEFSICLSDIPTNFGADYIIESESSREDDIKWLREAFPYAKVTEKDGQYILHTDKDFRANLEKEIRNYMKAAAAYLKKEIQIEDVNLASIKYTAESKMRTTDTLFHLDYMRTDIKLLEWLRYNPNVKKLYIGGILDFHY